MAYHEKRPGKAVKTRKRIAKKRTIKTKSCFIFCVIYVFEACVRINFIKTPRVRVYNKFNYFINLIMI